MRGEIAVNMICRHCGKPLNESQYAQEMTLAEEVQDAGPFQPDAQEGVEDGDHQGEQDACLGDGQDRE